MNDESTNANAKAAETIFNAALAFNAAERPAYLAGACGDNLALRHRVEALLRAHEASPGFLPEQPPSSRPAIKLEFTDAQDEAVGQTIGRYKLLEKLGEGGCGVVYVAEQAEPVRRRVALKVIKLGMDTRAVVARFEAERQALAMMDHPNIAKILDAGTTGAGRPFFVMELVKGVPITRYCDESNLSTVKRLGLFVQVCQAIQHAHQKGIIHRDIKPTNVLVADHDGVPVPKIIDFGIAKATNDQRLTDKTLYTAFEQFIGTPAYMSPEQARLSGLDIDTRSDIYSLGVLLYELLTGTTPFEARRLLAAGLDEIRRIIREEEPVRPSTRLHTLDAAEQTTVAKHRQTDPPKLAHLIRGDLDWIVMKALEKDRGRRYETANGLAMDIQRHLNHEPVVACPPSNFYRFQKMVSRNKLVYAAGVAVGAAVLVGLTVSTFLFIQERQAHAHALAAEQDQRQLRLEAVAESTRAKSEAERALAAEKTAAAAARRAEESAQVATNALQKAEAAAKELSRNMAASDFSMAVRLIAENQRNDALAYLTRSLALDPKNDAATTRLATLLASRAWWVPRWAFKYNGDENSARFSPDGKLIITSGFGAGVRLWEAASGQPWATPWKSGGDVVAAFSPDGKRIVLGSLNETAQVWDVETGQPLTGPLPHKGVVVSAQFSLDGKSILTTTTEKNDSWGVLDHAPLAARAWVWDAGSGRLLAGPMQPTNRILSAQFSPDGKRILTAGGAVRLWDAASGQLLGEPLKNSRGISSAWFSPDGKQILTASSGNVAQVWDADTGQPVNQPLRHNAQVFSAQYSLDGTRILTASADGTARIWDGRSGEPVGEPLKHSRAVYAAQFSPDGTRIVTANGEFGALVWERVSGQALAEQPWKGRGEIAQVSADGKRFVTTSLDGTAQVFDAQTGQPITPPLKHKGPVLSAQFSLDGQRIVTAASDTAGRSWELMNGMWQANNAWVWDAQSGVLLGGPFRHKDFLISAKLSPDGKRIVTASDDRTARVWDVRSGQPLTGILHHGGMVRSAQFSPDGKWIVTASIGGTNGLGTVYRLTTNSVFSPLASLNSSAGSVPAGALVQGTNGLFYGTTSAGGSNGWGTVFTLTTNGITTALVSLQYAQGAYPSNGLIQTSDGTFYGTASSGGTNRGWGTVFRLTADGTLTALHSFNYQDGANPVGGLLQGTDGNLYGTTSQGGMGGQGTVFQITTNGLLTTLVWFDGPNGGNPQSALIQANNGYLYGTAEFGGTGYDGAPGSGDGLVFRLVLPMFLRNPFAQTSVTVTAPYSASLSSNAVTPAGDELSFAAISGPTWLNVATNGTLSGMPGFSDVGTNLFNLILTDINGWSSTATMSILVLPLPSISISTQGTNMVLSWTGGQPPYSVQTATNLANSAWQTIAGPMTNTTFLLTPSNSPAFYRIQAQ